MGKNLLKRVAWFTVFGCLSFAGIAFAADKPADQILAEIKAVELPTRPASFPDQEAFTAFMTAQQKAMQTKADLIGELFKAYPENPELADLLPIRWQALRTNVSKLSAIQDETTAVIAKSHDDKLVADAYYNKAFATIMASGSDAKLAAKLADFEIFTQKYPKDVRLSALLMTAASRTKDLTEQETLFKRIETEFPKSAAARQVAGMRAMAEADRKKLERVGKPFELEFTDAIKGTQISMANLKGKVVVIDFWATWCGPCIAEIPNMKKIYAEYKDKGVEFIGISLDQPKEKGGLDKLKDYVAKNNIEWPQYYQGNYWKSEFSSSWGINSIPCVFLIDADGNLASIKARGQLETLIPEYLEKAKAKKTAGNP